MAQRLAAHELAEADVVIRPATGTMRGTDFSNRHLAIIEGEKAGLAAIAAIKQKIAEKTSRIPAVPSH